MITEIAASMLLTAAAPAEAAVPSAPRAVTEHVRPEADGTVSLSHEVLVGASPAQVWTALTTVDGWKSWAVPVAWIADDRPDVIETSYDPAAAPGDAKNIQNEFIARVPQRRVMFHTIKAPAGFPHSEALRRVTQTFELEPVGADTRVRLTGTGYGDDASGKAMLAFFKAGNRVSLEMLRDRFANGPINWTEKLKKPLK